MDIFERLRDYFQQIADALSDDKEASKIFPNPVDAGTSREDILIEFLIRHLPKRCEAIKGGFIFDSIGNESKQIDLIITNDLTLQFRQFDKGMQQGKSFNCVEGCYGAVSVKTKLDKANLWDSLANIASIPPMPDLGNRINPFITGQAVVQNLPYKVVFAFEGISPDTLLPHLGEYYAQAPVPENRRPDLVVVNNKYAIIHIGENGGTLRNGTKIAPYTFFCVKHGHVGAYSLIYMLVQIQKASGIGSQIMINFEEYLNRIPF